MTEMDIVNLNEDVEFTQANNTNQSYNSNKQGSQSILVLSQLPKE